MLDGGEFELLRSKIYLQQFCEFKGMKCFKISADSVLSHIGRKLFGLGKDDGKVSKLAYYNPTSDHLELYPKDVWLITSKRQVIQGKNCWRCMRAVEDQCLQTYMTHFPRPQRCNSTTKKYNYDIFIEITVFFNENKGFPFAIFII